MVARRLRCYPGSDIKVLGLESDEAEPTMLRNGFGDRQICCSLRVVVDCAYWIYAEWERLKTMGATFELGDTVTIKWRPDRPVRVDKRMYEAVTRLRSALIVASQRRSTLTYGEASAAIDEIYPARGLGRALDLLSQDCIERKEPSLAALVVQSTSGAVGGGFKGNAQAERERCYKHWGGSRP